VAEGTYASVKFFRSRVLHFEESQTAAGLICFNTVIPEKTWRLQSFCPARMDFVDLLQRCRSDSAEVRKVAEETLHRLEAENYSAYIHSLCTVFNGTTRDTGIQRLAAIVLKNTLQSKNVVVKVSAQIQIVSI